MAAILTNIDMPKDCYKCEFSTFNNLYGSDYSNRCMFISSIIDIPKGSKLDNCPLRSADKVIAEIENCSETYPAGWDKRRSKTAKEMKQDILEIINKYCKENNK